MALLICTFLLGIFFDILFYGKDPGVSYPLFVSAFYAVLFFNCRKNIKVGFSFGWLITIPIIALSLTWAIYSNDIFRALNFLGIPVLIVAQTILITGANRYRWDSPGFAADLLHGFVYRTFAFIFKPFALLAGILSRKHADNTIKAGDTGNAGSRKTWGKVAVGIGISIPLVFIIIALLSSADLVFNKAIGLLPDFLKMLNIREAITHVIIVMAITLVFFSYIWSLHMKKPQGAGIPAGVPAGTPVSTPAGILGDGNALKRFIDPVTAITVIMILNVIYLFFSLIQFSYLFGALNLSLPSEFTYAEYARRGFFELVFVTFINLGVFLFSINFTKQIPGKTAGWLRFSEAMLLLFTMILLFSAFFRMALYEQAYGYTYLRVLTHSFMIFLFLILAISLYRLWNPKMSLVRWYVLIALISYTVLNYINIDSFIAAKNIARYHKIHKIDVAYIATLSYDAVPYLVDLARDKDPAVAAEAKSLLDQKSRELSRAGNTGWQSFNLSRYNAGNIIQAP